MATRFLGDTGFGAFATRAMFRGAAAGRAGSRVTRERRTVNAWLLGLDDSTLATFGFDRMALEETGRGPFPL